MPRSSWKDNLKERLSRFYLDCGEKLPSIGKDWIPTLKMVREFQRENQQRAHQRTRPPAGCEIVFKELRLIELFPIEDYERMEDGLRKLFPADIFGTDPLADFKRTATSLTSTGRTVLGWLTRERVQLAPMQQAVLPELPPECERAVVKLHKVLPSTFVITVDVVLASSLSEELRRLQSGSYLPPVRFPHYFPWGWRVHNHSEGSAEFEIEKAVTRKLVDVRRNIEFVISPFISGYFASQNVRDSLTRLPAIEVLNLKGAPKEGDFAHWASSVHGWLETFGIGAMEIEYYGFKDSEMVFITEPADSYDEYAQPYLLLLLDPDSADEHRRERQPFLLEELEDAVLPFVVLGEFLDRTQVSIEQLRRKVYERLRQKPRGKLSADFRLNELIENESMLLSRFEAEMKQSEEFLKREAQVLGSFQGIAHPDKKLSEVVPQSLKFQTEFIVPHLDLSSRLFSNFVSLKNLAANYTLQRRMLFWTVIVSIATLVSLWITMKSK